MRRMGRLATCAAIVGLWLSLGSCRGSTPAPFEPPINTVDVGPLVLLPSDSLLHDVRDAWEDGSGRIWLLSGFSPFLRVYGGHGGLLSSFGLQGEGPGELRNPWYLVGSPRRVDEIQVWDVGTRRISRFDTLGTYLSGVRVDFTSGPVLASFRHGQFGEPLRLASAGERYVLEVYSRQLAHSWNLWGGLLLLVDSAGSVIDTLTVYSELRDSLPPDEPSVFGMAPLWTPCGVAPAVLQPETGELFRFSLAGDASTRGVVNLPEIGVSQTDVARQIESLVASESREQGLAPGSPGIVGLIKAAVLKAMASAPSVAPPVRMRCDPSGGIWIQTFSTEFDARGYGPLWIRTDPGTGTQEWFRFPNGFQPLGFGDRRIVGIHTDSLGVQVPGWVPMPVSTVDTVKDVGG